MTQEQIEMTRVVAIYMLGEQWYCTQTFNNLPIPDYHTSLDALAPVGKRVWDELFDIQESHESCSSVWNEAEDQFGYIQQALELFNAERLFEALHAAITFLNRIKTKQQ